jgi:transcriptional regulator with XRE-family HTH domain
MREVRDRIRERRKELQLSATEVAEALGLSRATIHRYESDEINKLPSEVLIPLARVLQTTPAWLMGWEDGPDGAPPPTNILEEETINLIAMAALRLTRAERKKVLDMIKLMYPKAFDKD